MILETSVNVPSSKFNFIFYLFKREIEIADPLPMQPDRNRPKLGARNSMWVTETQLINRRLLPGSVQSRWLEFKVESELQPSDAQGGVGISSQAKYKLSWDDLDHTKVI